MTKYYYFLMLIKWCVITGLGLCSGLNKLHAQAERIDYQGFSFDVYRAHLQTDSIGFFYRDSTGARYGNFENLKASLEKQGQQLLFATNAGIFKPGSVPLGLSISNGKRIQELDTLDGRGNFYLKPNGVFAIGATGAVVKPSDAFKQVVDSSIQLATQSGPMLVINNQVHPAFNQHSTNLNIRSGVGVVTDNEVVLAISNQRVNFYLFASFFRDVLNCPNALYLDGAISMAYIPALGRHELGGNFAGIIAITKTD